MMKKIMLCVVALTLSISPFLSMASSKDSAKTIPDRQILNEGASLYIQHCSLCHGKKGMGEGPISMSIRRYPRSNLFHSKYKKTVNSLDKIIKVVTDGGKLSDDSVKYMPPWKGQLSEKQIFAVSNFIQYLVHDNKSALVMINDLESKVPVSVKQGKIIYMTRCAMCHGFDGKGKGRMARIVKDPPPFNLTLSRASDEYLRKIILFGGEGVNRSIQMPAWKGELTSREITSVIMYIKTLRQQHDMK